MANTVMRKFYWYASGTPMEPNTAHGWIWPLGRGDEAICITAHPYLSPLGPNRIRLGVENQVVFGGGDREGGGITVRTVEFGVRNVGDTRVLAYVVILSFTSE